MALLTEKDQKLLNELEKNAKDTLKLCEDAKSGKITMKELENRISKNMPGAPAAPA
jgi:DNA-binding Lrp family transcriptional regulator